MGKSFDNLKEDLDKRIEINKKIQDKLVWSIITVMVLLISTSYMFYDRYYQQFKNSTNENKHSVHFENSDSKFSLTSKTLVNKSFEIKENNKSAKIVNEVNNDPVNIFAIACLVLLVIIATILSYIVKEFTEKTEKLSNALTMLLSVEDEFDDNKKKIIEYISTYLTNEKLTIYNDIEDKKQLQFNWLKKQKIVESRSISDAKDALESFYPATK